MAEPTGIKLDLANAAARNVGEHGLTEEVLAGLFTLVPHMQRIIHDERAQGRHAYLNLPSQPEVLEEVLRLAGPRLGRYAHLVVLGIGGSSLGLRALVNALGAPGAPQLHIIDNTDPALFHACLSAIEPAKTLVIVISKSGGTIETVLALGVFAQHFRKAGLKLADHFIAVTDPESGPLRRFADEHGLPTADIPPGVGGRFSVLTAAGLLPAALMNLDVAELMQGAARGEAMCRRPDCWPAMLAMIATELLRLRKSQIVFMPYSSRLRSVSDWFVQLWDESLGKATDLEGKTVNAGQTAIPAAGATDQHAQLQLFLEGPNDKLLLFLRLNRHEPDLKLGDFEWQHFDAAYVQGRTLGEVLNAQHAGTARACTERGRPNATLELPQLDASTLGELLMGLELATTCAALSLDVNPYDQPSVELGKKISRKMLGG